MHLRHIFNFIGILIFFLGISMAAPLAVSIFYKDGSTQSLLYSMAITSVIGLALFVSSRKHEETQLGHRDAEWVSVPSTHLIA